MTQLVYILKIALVSRILVYIIGTLSHLVIPTFDANVETLSQEGGIVTTLFGHFANWDGVHFVRIASLGYEHKYQHAFFPLFPFLIRFVGNYVIQPVLNIDSTQEVMILSGFLISNLAFIASTMVLFKLSVLLSNSKDLNVKEKLGILVVKIYSFSNCSIFLSAVYSESIFALFAFSGMYSLYRNHTFLAALLFSFSSAARSTGIIFIIYLIFYSIQKRRLVAIFLTPLVIAPFQMYIAYATSIYCHNQSASWCDEYTNIYSYIQDKYWNVGLFKYWTFKQIPNFLLAFPAMAVTVCASYYFVFLSLSNYVSEKRTFKCHTFVYVVQNLLKNPMTPFIAHILALLIVTLFVANVQIFTRQVSCCPIYYYYLALLLMNNNWKRSKFLKLYMYIHGLYFVIGPVMFCSFLPWT